MKTMWKRYGLFALLSLLLIAVDQWSKALAYDTLRVDGPIALIQGVFELYYSENRGAAFGILQGKQWFFSFGGRGRRNRNPSFSLQDSLEKTVRAAVFRPGASLLGRGWKRDRPRGPGLCRRFLLFPAH